MGPRRIVNVLCSTRKLDSLKFPARQTDRQKIENIAVDLIARFLRRDAETGKKLFAAGSGFEDKRNLGIFTYLSFNP
jgi:hypothetical protein